MWKPSPPAAETRVWYSELFLDSTTCSGGGFLMVGFKMTSSSPSEMGLSMT